MECKKISKSFLDLNIGQTYVVKQVLQGLEPKYKLRLLELGFLPGEKILIKQKSFNNKTFLVEVRQSMFVLQENIVKFIEVVNV